MKINDEKSFPHADRESFILRAQHNELTEYRVYTLLAGLVRDSRNREVLQRIAADELRHARFWEALSGRETAVSRRRVVWYRAMAWIFGITFAVKLMERGEDRAQLDYASMRDRIEGIDALIRDEEEHEQALLNILDEERVRYTGSIVLGLNDALVEFTGALAGFTFAVQQSRIIAMIGLITGISASLSMAASEYLSTRQEEDGKNPLKASLYTGGAYILTVLFLISPFLLIANVFLALAWTLINALLVILLFTFYVAVAKDLDFKKRFTEMAAISLGVAAVSFLIGLAVRTAFGVEL